MTRALGKLSRRSTIVAYKAVGGGTSLFVPGPTAVTLCIERAQVIDGVVHLTYRVDRIARERRMTTRRHSQVDGSHGLDPLVAQALVESHRHAVMTEHVQGEK